MRYTLDELARELDLHVHGDGNTEISGVASIASAGANHLVFATDLKSLDEAARSKASAIVATAPADGKPTLVAAHPKLAFARAAALLHDRATFGIGVHPTAVLGKNVKVALGSSIGPHCALGDNVEIGARTHISDGCHLGNHVKIGDQCVIHAKVAIYSKTTLGNRVTVHGGSVLGSDGFGFVRDPKSGTYEKFPQHGTLTIGDDVEIGANCTIDRGALDATTIGNGVKLDNMVHIGHNVQIGNNVVIAAQTGISGSSIIEDDVVIAGQVGIADHVTIKRGAILGAQCGVPTGKVIQGGEVYWGTPARPIKGYLKELAVLARLAKKKDQ
jgi:UDP-3-O-[3-hydroxymyristoyl] glucosamine N-acyltransferase